MRRVIFFSCILFVGCTSPNISSIDPPFGSPGQEVIIVGNGFGPDQGANQVIFSQEAAGEVTSWSSTEIKVIVPEGSTTGGVKVDVHGIESNLHRFIVSRNRLSTVPVIRTIDLEGYPYSSVSADFNSDDILDLAVGTSEPATMVILLGSGDGRFGEPLKIDLEGWAAGVIFADDIDGDLNVDVGGFRTSLTSDGRGEQDYIVTLFGDGQGGFPFFVDTLVDVEPRIGTYNAGDFNQDGKIDIVVGHRDQICELPGDIRILLGDGAGTFSLQPEKYPVGVKPYLSIENEDLNNDGSLDLVVCNFGCYYGVESDISILFGDGTGGFEPQVKYPVGAGPSDIAVSDLDYNGSLDIVVANEESEYFTILFNDGTGDFSDSVEYPIRGTSSVHTEDYNGDGLVDLLAFGLSSDGLFGGQTLLGFGDGEFVASAFLSESGNAELGDWNGDGIIDLAIPAGLGGIVDIVTGDGSGAFGSAEQYEINYDGYKITKGDFDEDGIDDLVVAALGDWGAGDVEFLSGDGEGGFVLAGIIETFRSIGHSISRDFNDDGHLDLAYADSTVDELLLVFGNGDGTFDAPVAFPIPYPYEFQDSADFDGDGSLDIALMMWEDYNEYIAIFYNDGNGEFSTTEYVTIAEYPHDPNSSEFTTDDFNGDGRVDLAVTYSGIPSQLRIYLSEEAGGYELFQTYSECGYIIEASDINHDGILDLLGTRSRLGPEHPSYFRVLIGGGDGSFIPQPEIIGGGYGITVDDINSDGHPDVMLPHGVGVRVLIGDGTGSFTPTDTYLALVAARSTVTGDFNRDGKTDVAVSTTSYATGMPPNVTVLLGNGEGEFVDYD